MLLCAHSFRLSHHFSVDVPLMPYCPAEDVRRKVPSPGNGSRIDNGAVSALYREKQKADHTLHDHTFHEYLLFSVCGSTNVRHA